MVLISVHDIKFSAWLFHWPICSCCGKILFFSALCKFFRIESYFLFRDTIPFVELLYISVLDSAGNGT